MYMFMYMYVHFRDVYRHVCLFIFNTQCINVHVHVCVYFIIIRTAIHVIKDDDLLRPNKAIVIPKMNLTSHTR